MTTPLQFQQYLALSELTKDELINLCMSLNAELGGIAIKKHEVKLKRAQAKADKYIEEVRVKVYEVFVDLTDDDFPTYEEMELELNRRFPEKKWVYDDIASPEEDEQGFYRPLLRIKEYLEFVNKQQM